ncbi:MAG TPA: hypothetical protein VG435_10765 [Acidimicrobiales bacterium]|nr:hypothetical protein [Acidimicrobiales bacterium]
MSAGGLVLAAPAASAAVPAPGSFDTSFGSSGFARDSQSDHATGMAVVPSGAQAGDVVVSAAAGTKFRVERFTKSGALDTGFASGAAQPFSGGALGVTVTPTGNVIAVGYESSGTNCGGLTPVVAEFSPTGSLVPTFGVNGVATVSCPSSGGELNDVALTSTGQIVVAGFSFTPTQKMLVGDLTAAGSLNASFNTTGWEALSVGSGQTSAQAVTVAANGDFVALGTSYPDGTDRFLTLAAFQPSGALDPGFTCSVASCSSPQTGVVTPADQSGSVGYGLTSAGTNLVASGSSASGHVLLFGVTDAGAPIHNFGSGGEVVGAQTGAWNAVTYAATGGFLVAAGQTGTGSATQLIASEYVASTGTLNPSFGSGGTVTKSYPTGPAAAYADAFDPQGRVLVAGKVPVVNAVTGTAVARLIGPAVTIANHALVRVYSFGNTSMTMTGSLDEPLNSPAVIELCASSGGSINGAGPCAGVSLVTGQTRFSFTLTVDVTASYGNEQTVTVGLQSGAFPGTGSSGSVQVQHLLPPPAFNGYRLVASDGGIFSFGGAPFYGSTGGVALAKPIVGMTATPDGRGYWMVASDGGIFAFGDAHFYGSTGGVKLAKPIVAMATTSDGKGYWLVASDGGIFAFGDAHFYGSTGGVRLAQPIVGMTSTPDGKGYWMVASDGGIFAFGDARFLGSTGGVHLDKPIVAMAAFPGAPGYWLVASDGGIFSYGAAHFYGSTGGIALAKPIVGMAATPDGAGYWLVATDGGIFAFGDAHFYGSTGGVRLAKPIVGMTGP